MLSAGKLNRRVIVQRREVLQDPGGQPIVGGWTDYGRVWANIRALSGLGAIRADAQTSITRVSIRIRYRAGITSAMRIIYADCVYEIIAVLPDEARREYMDLVCEVRA